MNKIHYKLIKNINQTGGLNTVLTIHNKDQNQTLDIELNDYMTLNDNLNIVKQKLTDNGLNPGQYNIYYKLNGRDIEKNKYKNTFIFDIIDQKPSSHEIMHSNKTQIYTILDDNGNEMLSIGYYDTLSQSVPFIYPRFKSGDIVRVCYPPQLYDGRYDAFQKQTNGFTPKNKKLYNLKGEITEELLVLKDVYNKDNINYTIKIENDEYISLINEIYIAPIYKIPIYENNLLIELTIYASRYHFNSDKPKICRIVKIINMNDEIKYKVTIHDNTKHNAIELYTHEIDRILPHTIITRL